MLDFVWHETFFFFLCDFWKVLVKIGITATAATVIMSSNANEDNNKGAIKPSFSL